MKTYKCEDCHDTGWSGDMGPGISGNREYSRCDCQMKTHARASLTLYANKNEDAQLTCFGCRREKCDLSFIVPFPGCKTVHGIHSKCLEILKEKLDRQYIQECGK